MTRLHKVIRELLFTRGIIVSRVSNTNRVQSLLNRLWPKETDKRLIRMGGENDGGYLIPDDLNGSKYCFSPGVSDVADFELSLVDYGVECFLADYSVEEAPTSHPQIHFEKKFLGINDSDTHLTLETWVQNAPLDDNDLILQMDIEGHEWPVLSHADSELLARFRIMAIEFHDFDKIFEPTCIAFFEAIFQKLLEIFEVVHVHPNNAAPLKRVGNIVVPQIIEITFIRRDRIQSIVGLANLPHSLDARNVMNKPEIQIPLGWGAKF